MKVLCPDKEVCGSCGWSHIPYEKQLTQKLSDINGSLALKELPFTCDQILPSPRTSHYRNRMDFVIDFEGRVGLRQKGKWWKVIDDHCCFISDQKIEEIFKIGVTWAKQCGLAWYDRKAHTGLLRYLVIRATSIGETLINVVTSVPSSEDEAKLAHEKITELARITSATTVLWAKNSTQSDVSFGDQLDIVIGEGVIKEEIAGYQYLISPQAFFQTNSYAAPLLMNAVVEYAGDVANKKVLDLYCGSGFFTMPLAKVAGSTVGVELEPLAIMDARQNAELNRVSVQFFDEAVEKKIDTGSPEPQFDWGTLDADVVIVDPPRSGMHDKAFKKLCEVKPERLVYVSCNYKHFAREMQTLKDIYNLEAIKAIDMFPHTPHVELVACLTRKD